MLVFLSQKIIKRLAIGSNESAKNLLIKCLTTRIIGISFQAYPALANITKIAKRRRIEINATQVSRKIFRRRKFQRVDRFK